MSFTLDASKSQTATTTAANVPTTSNVQKNCNNKLYNRRMSYMYVYFAAYTFGTMGAGDTGKPTGFSLTQTPTQNKTGSVFGSGVTITPVQGTGFSFGTQAVAPAATPANTATPQTPGLTFGTGVAATASITPTATSTLAPKLYSATTPIGGASSFTLGGTTTVATTATPVSGFGAKPLTGTTSSTPTSGLTFGTPKAGSTGFTVGTTAAPGTKANYEKLDIIEVKLTQHF